MESSIRESSQHKQATNSEAPPTANTLQLLLQQLWITSQATVAQRLETLQTAQIRMEQNSLDARVRKQAADAAHKLAGILGTFGLPEGSTLALRVETAMENDTATLDAKEFAAILDELSRLVAQKSAGITSL
jgi:HPt (histidine-containing phosphotransfer) domain-containing protein